MNQAKHKVLLAAPTFNSTFQAEIHQQAMRWIKPEQLVLRSMTDDPEEQTRQLETELTKNELLAVIAISIQPSFEVVVNFRAKNVPIILIDEQATGTTTVTSDNREGGRIAGKYLTEKGRQKIAIVSGRTQAKGGFNARDRLQGFRNALAEAGQTIPTGAAIEVLHYSREDGLEVMPTLLALGVDAIFCAAGDMCASGLLAMARERGAKVPDDIAVIGYDDVLIARMSSPRLTTIKQPIEKITQTACELALTGGERLAAQPKRVVLPPELVVRESA